MRNGPRLPAFSARYFFGRVLPLLAIIMSTGCSDPPDTALLQRIKSKVDTANRLVVSASGDWADPGFQSVEITGSEKAAQVLATLEFSSRKRFHRSPLRGDYEIRWFSNSQPLLVLTLSRSSGLSWALPDSTEAMGVLKASSLRALLTSLATNGCDIVQKEQAAEDDYKNRKAQAERNCVASFPPQVQPLFSPAPMGTYLPPWEAERGHRLAAAIHDPVALTVLTSKGLACLGRYSYGEEHEGILLAAINTVSGPDLAAGLRTIEKDRGALLGASRFFFRNDYTNKLSEKDTGFWSAKLAEVELNDGDEDHFAGLLASLSPDRSPEVHDLLRKLARGETGKQYPVHGSVTYAPLVRPMAYLCLALHEDAEVKSEIEALLSGTTRWRDRTVMELALALLDPSYHVQTNHFGSTQPPIEEGAIAAVEKFPTPENLDALVFGGLNYPEHSAFNVEKSVAVFEKIVHQHWPFKARYDGTIIRWWRENRVAFLSNYTWAKEK